MQHAVVLQLGLLKPMSFGYSVLLSIYMENQILPFESDHLTSFFNNKTHNKNLQNPQLSIFISQNDMLSASLQLSGGGLAPSLHEGAEVSLKIKAFRDCLLFLQADVVYCTYIYIYVCVNIYIYIHMYRLIYWFICSFVYLCLFVHLIYSHFDTM